MEEAQKALLLGDFADGNEAFACVKDMFDTKVKKMKEKTEKVSNELHCLFSFVEQAFADGNEMLILVTELTVQASGARFIARFGSEDYRRHSSELMISERQSDMQKEIAALDL